MALGIPLPGSFGKAFVDSANTGSNIMNRITQSKLQRDQLNETKRAHKVSEDRQNQLLPHLIQQYKDKHAAEAYEQYFRDKIIDAIKKGDHATVQAIMDNHPTAKKQAEAQQQQQSGGMTLAPQMDTLPEQPGFSSIPEQSGGMTMAPQMPSMPAKTPNMQALEAMIKSFGGKGMMQSQDQPGGMPMPGQQTQQMPQIPGVNEAQDLPGGLPMPQQEQQPAPEAPQQQPAQPSEAGQAPGEVVLEKGNPELYPFDKFAGKAKSIPAVKAISHNKDGVTLQYPSGKIVFKPTPSTEKKTAEKETTREREEAKESVKREKEALAAGEIVNKYAGNMQKIHELLKKSKNISGNIAGVKNILHLNTEDQGAFKQATLPLTAKLAKDISQRGGAVAAGMASQGKPGTWESHAGNVGLNKGLIKEAINTYFNAKEQYERDSEKPYPIKLDPFLRSRLIKIKSSDGGEHIIAAANLDKAKARDDGLIFIGLADE